jgi:hypothetical protein
MKLTLNFAGFDQASRRLALNTARRAEALLQIGPAPIAIRREEPAADGALGGEAWPGGTMLPPAEPREARR